MEIINDNSQNFQPNKFDPNEPYQQYGSQQQPQQQPQPQPQQQFQQQIYPHSNKLAWSILITIFCCVPAGVVSIVHSAISNNMYDRYLEATDEQEKMKFYALSERKNKIAGTWITIGIICGLAYLIICLIYVAAVAILGIGDY